MINGLTTAIDTNVLARKANQRFDNIDANKDASLSRAEVDEVVSTRTADRLFADFDLDQDGIITREEHDQVIAERVQHVIDNQSDAAGGGGRRGSSTNPVSESKAQITKQQYIAQNLLAHSSLSESIKPNIVAELSQTKGVKAYLAAYK